MATNNITDHYPISVPLSSSTTLKTHPMRRRILRKSPRSSMRLSTLRKALTSPQGNDHISLNSRLSDAPSPADETLGVNSPGERLSGRIPLKTTSNNFVIDRSNRVIYTNEYTDDSHGVEVRFVRSCPTKKDSNRRMNLESNYLLPRPGDPPNFNPHSERLHSRCSLKKTYNSLNNNTSVATSNRSNPLSGEPRIFNSPRDRLHSRQPVKKICKSINNLPIVNPGNCYLTKNFHNSSFELPSERLLGYPLKPSPSDSSPGGFLRLFSCPGCNLPLRQPVTLECGHTCCQECGLENCPDCGSSVKKMPSVNVLVRSIVNKLIGEDDEEKEDSQKEESMKKSNIFHPYNLRCRHSTRQKKASKYTTSKIKENNKICENDESLFEKALSTSPSELECILCCGWLRAPVTTSCGHTFCRGCLDRVLDHGLGCPLCMGRLSPGHLHATPTTLLLQEAVNLCCPPREGIEDNDMDTQVPVFICTSAFPMVPCPLYVYEPRYRLLTRRCLQSGTRRFAMAAGTTNSSDRFAPYGTILEVRDAVHLRDGRSILTTVGVRRFRVLSRGEKDGYDTATVEYIRDTPLTPSQLPGVRNLHDRVLGKARAWVRSLGAHVQAEIQQSLGAMPPLESDWPMLPDGPAWSWWLMPVLPLNTQLQVGFLSTTSLEKRLRAIDKMLDRMSVRMRSLKRTDMYEKREESIEICSSSTLVHRSQPGVEL